VGARTLSIGFAFFNEVGVGIIPSRNLVRFVTVGSAGSDLMEGFHGFEVSTAAHECEHVVATFPGGEGTLVAAFSFYLGEQNALGRLGLCEGGDGQSPKPEKADNSFGFEAGD